MKLNIKLNKARVENFEKIDWQKKSMPSLAWITNSIFTGDKVNSMSKWKIIEKIEHSGYSTTRQIEDDLSRLIVLSNGWLKVKKTSWIKRDRNIDINNVCKLLLI